MLFLICLIPKNKKGLIFIFERYEIQEGVFFNKITDKRFKGNQISLHFLTDFDDASRADFSAASYILTDSCKRFPQYKELSRHLANLYNASLSSNTLFSSWDQRSVVINASVLDNKYALGGENLEAEMCELIRDCLLFPNAENGAFDETVTSLMKGELIDTIDSSINNKSTYAARNANMTAFRGEVHERPALGTHEEAEQVTARSAYNAYRKILETSRVEIFVSGCSEFDDARRIFTEMFKDIPRHDICGLSASVSPLKPKPEYVNDTISMQQAIIRMYFKAPDCSDREAVAMLVMILGGMTTSRFFMNIREKQSLCYYCSCFSYKYKRVITAYAGVEPENIERCENAILKELRDIAENGVTEEDLHTAKLEYFNQISSLHDNMSAMATWYFNQLTDEKIYTPEEFRERIDAVDRARVQAAARLFKLDTVYTLSGEEAAE